MHENHSSSKKCLFFFSDSSQFLLNNVSTIDWNYLLSLSKTQIGNLEKSLLTTFFWKSIHRISFFEIEESFVVKKKMTLKICIKTEEHWKLIHISIDFQNTSVLFFSFFLSQIREVIFYSMWTKDKDKRIIIQQVFTFIFWL